MSGSSPPGSTKTQQQLVPSAILTICVNFLSYSLLPKTIAAFNKLSVNTLAPSDSNDDPSNPYSANLQSSSSSSETTAQHYTPRSIYSQSLQVDDY
jgi:hypothetical protein